MTESVWSFWILSFIGAASFSAQQLGPYCDVSHFCDYSSKDLDAIPSGLTDDVTGLNLASNSIKQVSKMDLKFVVNLRTLLLHSNRIQTIDEDAFRVLVKLEHLDLSKNNLTHLSPSWFRHLLSLQRLNIKGNKYLDLGETPLFSDLQNLRFLYLGNDGYFSTLQKQDFEGISILEELEIEAQNLGHYEQGSLKSIKRIDHIILNAHSPISLISITNDTTDSVVCFELRNIQFLDNSYLYQFHPLGSASVQKVILRNVVLSDFSVGGIAPIFAGLNQLHELESLEVLDVSNNNLNDFRLSLPQLQVLYITNNKLTTLPDAAFIPSVRFMEVGGNKLMDFSKEQLGKFAELEMLDARNNSFSCSCQFISFVRSQEELSKVLVGWPENYICDSPSTAKGKQVQVAQLSLTECHRTLVVSLICILMLVMLMVVAVLCYKLHAIWYMKMTWAWLQAKRKPCRDHNKEICYDAFVSYSEHDSEWVENVMVQELEQANPPFKLCLHKRDFIAGKWIVDNIIDSIEKSYKTLFVLSKHFVQSEWCKYELDFSHFRLFDENNDAAILILLEPIPEQTIPKRFCKLRKLMNTKTYLEWPRDDKQEQIFWFNLKVALKSE
uniref:Uncharacterized protein n=1 Tax=Sphaerodactylus townsendi TaxID=933632 RepID=A0ACB8E7X2_9SAUR